MRKETGVTGHRCGGEGSDGMGQEPADIATRLMCGDTSEAH